MLSHPWRGCGETKGFAQPLWRNQGFCWQKKRAGLWTCSTNQANPPRVMARRLTGAQLREGNKGTGEVSLLDLGRGSHCALLCGVAASCFAFFSSPFNRLLGTSLPGIQGHPTAPPHGPPPSAQHSLHSPALSPGPPWLHSPLCHFIPSVITPPPLAPRSLLLARKGERWEGKGFPSSVQKCSSVSKDKACPLCNPPAAAATKAGRGGGPGAWGALCDPKGKTLRKEQNKYPLLPPLLNKRGQN